MSAIFPSEELYSLVAQDLVWRVLEVEFAPGSFTAFAVTDAADGAASVIVLGLPYQREELLGRFLPAAVEAMSQSIIDGIVDQIIQDIADEVVRDIRASGS